jgi:uncharacterized protein YggE
MTETIITVQGEYSAWYPAERATASITVQFDGPERDAVFSAATASAEAVRESIASLVDPSSGPVTWWSSDALRVWSERPWNQDGAQLPLVYSAAVGFTVKFSDFAILSSWIETTVELEGVTLSTIAWDLTDATRNAVTTEVRSRSVKDAVTKATVFAQSIGLGSVKAIALADPGMLGDQSNPSGGAPSLRMTKAYDSAGSPLQLKPEDIEVSSTVDARFVAS